MKKIEGTSGHAGAKAVVGGLLFGPVGAIVGAAHGISKEGHGEGLCLSCRNMEAEKELIVSAYSIGRPDLVQNRLKKKK
jgi:hypothetical protein